jgi:hypothetical protein
VVSVEATSNQLPVKESEVLVSPEAVDPVAPAVEVNDSGELLFSRPLGNPPTGDAGVGLAASEAFGAQSSPLVAERQESGESSALTKTFDEDTIDCLSSVESGDSFVPLSEEASIVRPTGPTAAAESQSVSATVNPDGATQLIEDSGTEPASNEWNPGEALLFVYRQAIGSSGPSGQVNDTSNNDVAEQWTASKQISSEGTDGSVVGVASVETDGTPGLSGRRTDRAVEALSLSSLVASGAAADEVSNEGAYDEARGWASTEPIETAPLPVEANDSGKNLAPQPTANEQTKDAGPSFPPPETVDTRLVSLAGEESISGQSPAGDEEFNDRPKDMELFLSVPEVTNSGTQGVPAGLVSGDATQLAQPTVEVNEADQELGERTNGRNDDDGANLASLDALLDSLNALSFLLDAHGDVSGANASNETLPDASRSIEGTVDAAVDPITGQERLVTEATGNGEVDDIPAISPLPAPIDSSATLPPASETDSVEDPAAAPSEDERIESISVAFISPGAESEPPANVEPTPPAGHPPAVLPSSADVHAGGEVPTDVSPGLKCSDDLAPTERVEGSDVAENPPVRTEDGSSAALAFADSGEG